MPSRTPRIEAARDAVIEASPEDELPPRPDECDHRRVLILDDPPHLQPSLPRDYAGTIGAVCDDCGLRWRVPGKLRGRGVVDLRGKVPKDWRERK